MEITKIERQKHDEKRYSVFIDGEFAFGMSGVDILYNHLEEGDEISADELRKLYDGVLFDRARDKATRFLAYRARSEKEVRDKLDGEGYPDEVIDRVVELLQGYGYIDDRKFAEAFVEDKICHAGCGKARLARELREKGIESEIIDEVLENTDTDEVALALAHLQKKTRGVREMDFAERQRYIGYLQRRGFTWDVVSEALGRFTEGE